MGYFIAYRHTGADPKKLDVLLPSVRDALESLGHKTYCTYFNEGKFTKDGYSNKEIMARAFLEIERLGKLFVIVDSDERSEGMLIEVGYCIAKDIDFVVAKREGTNTYLDQLATKSFEYSDLTDLKNKIEQEL